MSDEKPVFRLLKSADRVARDADAASLAFAKALRGVLRDLERKLLPLIVEAAGETPSAMIRAGQVNRVRQALARAMTEAGFPDLAEAATNRPYDRLADTVLADAVVQESAELLGTQLQAQIEALRRLHQLDLLDEGEAVTRALWQATARGVFGSRSAADILHDLGAVINKREAQLGTLYDTAVSIFGRQVEALKAGDDETATFLYAGPNDAKTRPFCQSHVGKVYTRADIDAMDNRQLDNVFLTGGGYNCRHIWMEVSRFSELRDLAGTGQRIPDLRRPAA